jgi:cation:H+ antiporter
VIGPEVFEGRAKGRGSTRLKKRMRLAWAAPSAANAGGKKRLLAGAKPGAVIRRRILRGGARPNLWRRRLTRWPARADAPHPAPARRAWPAIFRGTACGGADMRTFLRRCGRIIRLPGIIRLDYIYVLAGLIGLFFGGEALVRGSVGIARRMAISPLLIGLTVVGFGTSTPELLVSVDAAWRGVPDIALGNIVGSNIANILLVVGLSALICPIPVVGATLRRDTGFMMAAALALAPIFAWGSVGRPAGLALVLFLVIYLVRAFRHPAEATAPDEDTAPPASSVISAIWAVAGLVTLMLGARFLVDGAVSIARGHGISEAFIGLTIVAVGTSLPELATSLIAAFRRQPEIAIGNIIGSNIFNLLGILGVTAMITPVPVAPRFLNFDLPAMLAASLALTVLLLARPVIGRGFGAVMLASYLVYVWAAQG